LPENQHNRSSNQAPEGFEAAKSACFFTIELSDRHKAARLPEARASPDNHEPVAAHEADNLIISFAATKTKRGRSLVYLTETAKYLHRNTLHFRYNADIIDKSILDVAVIPSIERNLLALQYGLSLITPHFARTGNLP